MKKYIAYGIVIVWVIAIIQFVVRIDTEKADSIVTAFKSTNYIENESKLESFFYYGDFYLGVEDRKELLEGILTGLGIQHEGVYEEKKGEEGNVATLSYYFQGGDITAALTTIETPINKNVSYLSQYIAVEMNVSNSPETAWYYKEKLTHVLERLPYMSITPDVTLSLNGKINGKLTAAAQKELAQALFEQLQAKEVLQGQSDTEHNNTYGYSEQLQEYTNVGTTKVNVNVAFSYDEEKNITNLYLATPMINFDY